MECISKLCALITPYILEAVGGYHLDISVHINLRVRLKIRTLSFPGNSQFLISTLQ